MNAMNPTISVVIPALNEEARILTCLHTVHRALPQAEVIVVDGGSHDRTVALARQTGATVIHAEAPGRGGQCRLGASVATGEILVFIHADCQLAAEAQHTIKTFFAASFAHQLAKLRLTYTARRPIYRVLNRLAPIDHYFANTGDHGIVVRRAFYEAIGGMSELPLFEDVEFFQRARRHARLFVLDIPLYVSARRFEANGPLRQLTLDAWLMTRYALGACPHHLRKRYERRRQRRSWRQRLLLGAPSQKSQPH